MEHWYRCGQALLDQIAATHLPPEQLAVWYVGQCGFIFKFRETVVCIDAVLSDLVGEHGSRRHYAPPFAPEALDADLVLCTHGHADHMAKDTLKGLAQHSGTRFRPGAFLLLRSTVFLPTASHRYRTGAPSLSTA